MENVNYNLICKLKYNEYKKLVWYFIYMCFYLIDIWFYKKMNVFFVFLN